MRSLIALLLGVCFCPAVVAGATDPSSLEWEGGLTKVTRLSDGQVEASEIFRFKNNGSSPVSMKSVTASCGCTVPEYTKDPIAPGGQGEVKLQYTTKMPGVGRTVSANALFDNGQMLKLEWKVEDSPSPSYLAPVTAPSPSVEWSQGQTVDVNLRVDFAPGTKIIKLTDLPDVSTAFDEIGDGTGAFLLRFSRRSQKPFWGAIIVETSPPQATPYRINIRALK